VLAGRAELGLSDLPRLVVAEACFKEALRLHPQVGMINRCACGWHVLCARVCAVKSLLNWTSSWRALLTSQL
jgi:hypothetical protein